MRRLSLALALIPVATGTALAQTTYKGHGADSVPPEVIAQYAPKPLPPAGRRAHPDDDGRARAGDGRRAAGRHPALLRVVGHRHAAGLAARRPRPLPGRS